VEKKDNSYLKFTGIASCLFIHKMRLKFFTLISERETNTFNFLHPFL